jgi:hypothetical protein
MILSTGAAGTLRADTELPLQNPGFEDGLTGWTVEASNPAVAQVTADAASMGAKGLQVQSTPDCMTYSITSTPVPVTVGKSYQVSYWFGGGGAKAGGGVNVEMVFKDATGTEVKPALANIRKWPAAGVSGGTFINGFQLAAAAPAGASTLTVRIKSAKAAPSGLVYLDDFKVVELPDVPAAPPVVTTPSATPGAPPMVFHPVPPSDPARLAFLLKEINANPYRGKAPPKIVIKLDDLKPTKTDGVHPRWQKIVDYAKSKGIKVNFGIICDGLEMDCPKFSQWVKDETTSGDIEFWCHGYDHGQDAKAKTAEFSGEPYAYQKDHLEKCQTLAKERFGFPFTSFGAPFNATDKTTVQVMSEDPDFKVWMYGDPKNPGGKVVLERCGVGLETPTLIPNYGAFLENYAHNRGADYFCMQGHPAGWGDDRYAQFTMIVEFLIAQKADFVHPRDFAPGGSADLAAKAN